MTQDKLQQIWFYLYAIWNSAKINIQKFTKINEVEQYLIYINSKWPPFLPKYAYISSSETRRNLILVSALMF